MQLERTKESLARQISSQSASYEQVQVKLDDLTAERDLVRQQVSRSCQTGSIGCNQVTHQSMLNFTIKENGAVIVL